MNGPGILILNDDAAIRGNIATGRGGGIINFYGTVELNDDATVVSNTAAKTGGGIKNQGGPAHRGEIHICSDQVAISPNEPDDEPELLFVC